LTIDAKERSKTRGSTFSIIHQETKTDMPFGYGACLEETMSYKKMLKAKIVKK